MNKDQSDGQWPDEPRKMRAETAAQAEVACEDCGKYGAHEIGGHLLCVDCYQGKGSCCSESEKDQSDKD